MKYYIIALLVVPLTAAAQYLDDPYAGDRFYEQPNIGPDRIRGGTIRDNRGNRWEYQPNIGVGPEAAGATIIRRQRTYRSMRNRDYRDNY